MIGPDELEGKSPAVFFRERVCEGRVLGASHRNVVRAEMSIDQSVR